MDTYLGAMQFYTCHHVYQAKSQSAPSHSDGDDKKEPVNFFRLMGLTRDIVVRH